MPISAQGNEELQAAGEEDEEDFTLELNPAWAERLSATLMRLERPAKSVSPKVQVPRTAAGEHQRRRRSRRRTNASQGQGQGQKKGDTNE